MSTDQTQPQPQQYRRRSEVVTAVEYNAVRMLLTSEDGLQHLVFRKQFAREYEPVSSPPAPLEPSEAAEDAAVAAMRKCEGHYPYEDMKLEPLCMCDKCQAMLRAGLRAAYRVQFGPSGGDNR